MYRTRLFFLIACIVNLFYLILTFIFFYFLDSPLMNMDENDFLSFYHAGRNVIFDLPNFIRIDLKGAYTAWDKGAITEAETFLYENVPIKIARPEYLITNKLNKGGQIDLEDAFSVYFQNEERLDKKLLDELAELLNVKVDLIEFLAKASSMKDLEDKKE